MESYYVGYCMGMTYCSLNDMNYHIQLVLVVIPLVYFVYYMNLYAKYVVIQAIMLMLILLSPLHDGAMEIYRTFAFWIGITVLFGMLDKSEMS